MPHGDISSQVAEVQKLYYSSAQVRPYLQHVGCDLHDVREDRLAAQPAGESVQGTLGHHGVTVTVLLLLQVLQDAEQLSSKSALLVIFKQRPKICKTNKFHLIEDDFKDI